MVSDPDKCDLCGAPVRGKAGLGQHKRYNHNPNKPAPVRSTVAPRPEPPTPSETAAAFNVVPRGRNGAENLADLPWLVYPKTADECDDALNGLALAIERSNGASMPFLLSLRKIVSELRRRLKSAQPAAA